MPTLFLQVLNMSVTASCIIPVILLTRFLLQRAPKKYSYLLWSVVLYRLICPASFLSAISIFALTPFHKASPQQGGTVLNYVPSTAGPMQTLPHAGASLLERWITLATVLWCVGMVILLLESLAAWMRVRQRAATAVRMGGVVYESDSIRSPFIFGLLRPRILIPFGLSDDERAFILRHEQFHLQRKDHLIKPLGFALLVIHWFNPLVWLAFALMVKDMEMSCDELVLSEAGVGIVREYSTSLLSLAMKRRFPLPSPLAFGETGIRERVINILRFREPRKWASVLAVIACILMVTACAANPLQANQGYKLTGGTLIVEGNVIRAAYQRFEGTYRQEITLPQGRTRFFVTTSIMMRINVEDEEGQQLATSPSSETGAVLAKAYAWGTSDMIEVEVKVPGTYVLVVAGTDYNGSFQVSWGQPK